MRGTCFTLALLSGVAAVAAGLLCFHEDCLPAAVFFAALGVGAASLRALVKEAR